jgi:hypothetical protein
VLLLLLPLLRFARRWKGLLLLPLLLLEPRQPSGWCRARELRCGELLPTA